MLLIIKKIISFEELKISLKVMHTILSNFILKVNYFWAKLKLKMMLFHHNYHHFELADFNDLSSYSFKELKKKVLALNKGFIITKKFSVSGNFVAIFESKRTRLKILYNINGDYIYKLNEQWLD